MYYTLYDSAPPNVISGSTTRAKRIRPYLDSIAVVKCSDHRSRFEEPEKKLNDVHHNYLIVTDEFNSEIIKSSNGIFASPKVRIQICELLC